MDRVVLPSNVVPLHYQMLIRPNPNNLDLNGFVRITVEVRDPTAEITLNAADLQFDHAVLCQSGNKTATVSFDTEKQTATLHFDEVVQAGEYDIEIRYKGKIYESAQGLFISPYGTPEGRKHMLITQFEAVAARRFVPCWDEPARKATFSISVDAPVGLTVVSNMPIDSVSALGDGFQHVQFQKTPKMSSYLLFVGIGELEKVETDAGPVKVSLFSRKGSAPKGNFALESAALLLNFYNDYFGVSYPLPKLDLIAAPGSGGFSAMENWGAILYFENALLVDPNLTTEADRQRIFITVAHELAHQWFGNLVTMEWWDNLWLNEGFASWMENKATDHFHPEWMMWLQSEAARQRAMRQDSKNTTHPIVQPVATGEQADQAFDDITYRKGQAVIRMLETYVGEEIFRTGVQAYMKRYAYRNAVTEDFWAEIEGAGSKKITGIADDFTRQSGVPLVTVDSVVPDGNHVTLTLKQSRFCVGEGGCDPLVWHTPVSAVSVETKAPVTSELISGPEPDSLTVEGGLPVKINVGQTSYYRSQYGKEVFLSLAEQFWTLTPADQLGLLYDMWALGEAGAIPVSDYLDLTRETSSGAEAVIWQQIMETLVSIDTLYTDPARQTTFRTYGRKILTPVFGQVGWDAVPGQADNIAVLREVLIRTLGRFGEQAILNEARRRFDTFVANPNDPQSLPAAIRRPTLRTVALWADQGVYDVIHDLAVRATDPLEKDLLFTSLASAKAPELAKRSLDIALSDEPEKTTAPSMIARVAVDNPDFAWQFAISHLDQLNARLDAMQRYSFVPSIAAQSTNPDRLDDLRRFMDEQIPADARPQVERFYADLAYRLNVKEQRLPQIDQWIGAQEGTDELTG